MKRGKNLLDFISTPVKPKKPKSFLKIAFIGSHGVGKTTLCSSVHAGLKQRNIASYMIDEIASDLPKGFEVNEKTDFESQFYILLKQMERELIYTKKHYRVLCCDRSVLDSLAYSHNAMKTLKKIKMYEIRFMENFVKFWVTTYDYLFLVEPFANVIEDDNYRSTDVQFRDTIHEIILSYIEKMRIGRKIHIISGTINERTQKVMNILHDDLWGHQ
ncbi:MAG: AAA family ATPase [Candidatus Helarchaeota archaeon]